MKNPFRTRAKHEAFCLSKNIFIVRYRKWWQLRWHTLKSKGVYTWLSVHEHIAKGIAENINKGKFKI